jgi:two-component system, NarL family, response regulator LiaR
MESPTDETTQDRGTAISNGSSRPLPASGAPLPLEPAETIRVLVADSRPLVLGALAHLIEQERPRMHLVGQAGSYTRALYLAERLQPDVVILSVFSDTLDPLVTVSSLVRMSRARVLLLKGMHDPVPVARLLSMGAAGVVIAEDPTEEIVRAVMQVHQAPRNVRGPAPVNGNGGAKPTRSPLDAVSRLTERERELIRVIVAKPSAKYLAIGAQMGISEHTVHNHLTSIYQKLNVVNRTDMLLYAVRHGLVDEGPPRESLN